MPRRAWIAALVLAPLACTSPSTDKAASSSSASSAAPPPPAPTATVEAPAPPDDLDVAALQKANKCAGSKSAPCAVLAKMASCQAWDAIVPSGDGRWFGRGTFVTGAKSDAQYTLLRSRRVAMNDVAPGQLPIKISVVELTKSDGGAYEHADRALKAFDRGDVPPRSNPTMEHIKTRTEWPEFFAMKTRGAQIYGIHQGGAYFCAGPKRELLVVVRDNKRGASADGLYAELIPISW